MSRHGELQIHQRLDVRTVEMKDTLTEIKQPEGGDDPNFFSTSAMGSDFMSRMSLGFDPSPVLGPAEFESVDTLGSGSDRLGSSVVAFTI